MIVKLEDKLAYIIAVVSEFAAAFKLNPQQAYRYLDRFKGIDFVDKFYNPLLPEHALRLQHPRDRDPHRQAGLTRGDV